MANASGERLKRIAGISERSYPPSGLTSKLWLDQPKRFFLFRELTLTQPGINFHALFYPDVPVGGDVFPHVVIHKGINYLEDGHTRAIREMIEGKREIQARWIEV